MRENTKGEEERNIAFLNLGKILFPSFSKKANVVGNITF